MVRENSGEGKLTEKAYADSMERVEHVKKTSNVEGGGIIKAIRKVIRPSSSLGDQISNRRKQSEGVEGRDSRSSGGP